jgi:hypothetical protein
MKEPYSIEDELDSTFALELETTTDELNPPTDELEDLTTEEEFICPLLEYIPAEDELSPSVSVLLFPLSPSHAARIRATATIPNNAIRCFRFIFCSLP